MADSEWIENIKRIVLQAMEAGQPCDVVTATVVKESPLEIQIDQKTTLYRSQLLLLESLKDHKEEMVIPGIGAVTVTVKGGLKAGEKVLLIQKRGAQQYVVLSRW